MTQRARFATQPLYRIARLLVLDASWMHDDARGAAVLIAVWLAFGCGGDEALQFIFCDQPAVVVASVCP
jgi:hypothetical protein